MADEIHGMDLRREAYIREHKKKAADEQKQEGLGSLIEPLFEDGWDSWRSQIKNQGEGMIDAFGNVISTDQLKSWGRLTDETESELKSGKTMYSKQDGSLIPTQYYAQLETGKDGKTRLAYSAALEDSDSFRKNFLDNKEFKTALRAYNTNKDAQVLLADGTSQSIKDFVDQNYAPALDNYTKSYGVLMDNKKNIYELSGVELSDDNAAVASQFATSSSKDTDAVTLAPSVYMSESFKKKGYESWNEESHTISFKDFKDWNKSTFADDQHVSNALRDMEEHLAFIAEQGTKAKAGDEEAQEFLSQEQVQREIAEVVSFYKTMSATKTETDFAVDAIAAVRGVTNGLISNVATAVANVVDFSTDVAAVLTASTFPAVSALIAGAQIITSADAAKSANKDPYGLNAIQESIGQTFDYLADGNVIDTGLVEELRKNFSKENLLENVGQKYAALSVTGDAKDAVGIASTLSELKAHRDTYLGGKLPSGGDVDMSRISDAYKYGEVAGTILYHGVKQILIIDPLGGMMQAAISPASVSGTAEGMSAISAYVSASTRAMSGPQIANVLKETAAVGMNIITQSVVETLMDDYDAVERLFKTGDTEAIQIFTRNLFFNTIGEFVGASFSGASNYIARRLTELAPTYTGWRAAVVKGVNAAAAQKYKAQWKFGSFVHKFGKNSPDSVGTVVTAYRKAQYMAAKGVAESVVVNPGTAKALGSKAMKFNNFFGEMPATKAASEAASLASDAATGATAAAGGAAKSMTPDELVSATKTNLDESMTAVEGTAGKTISYKQALRNKINLENSYDMWNRGRFAQSMQIISDPTVSSNYKANADATAKIKELEAKSGFASDLADGKMFSTTTNNYIGYRAEQDYLINKAKATLRASTTAPENTKAILQELSNLPTTGAKVADDGLAELTERIAHADLASTLEDAFSPKDAERLIAITKKVNELGEVMDSANSLLRASAEEWLSTGYALQKSLVDWGMTNGVLDKELIQSMRASGYWGDDGNMYLHLQRYKNVDGARKKAFEDMWGDSAGNGFVKVDYSNKLYHYGDFSSDDNFLDVNFVMANEVTGLANGKVSKDFGDALYAIDQSGVAKRLYDENEVTTARRIIRDSREKIDKIIADHAPKDLNTLAKEDDIIEKAMNRYNTWLENVAAEKKAIREAKALFSEYTSDSATISTLTDEEIDTLRASGVLIPTYNPADMSKGVFRRLYNNMSPAQKRLIQKAASQYYGTPLELKGAGEVELPPLRKMTPQEEVAAKYAPAKKLTKKQAQQELRVRQLFGQEYWGGAEYTRPTMGYTWNPRSTVETVDAPQMPAETTDVASKYLKKQRKLGVRQQKVADTMGGAGQDWLVPIKTGYQDVTNVRPVEISSLPEFKGETAEAVAKTAEPVADVTIDPKNIDLTVKGVDYEYKDMQDIIDNADFYDSLKKDLQKAYYYKTGRRYVEGKGFMTMENDWDAFIGKNKYRSVNGQNVGQYYEKLLPGEVDHDAFEKAFLSGDRIKFSPDAYFKMNDSVVAVPVSGKKNAEVIVNPKELKKYNKALKKYQTLAKKQAAQAAKAAKASSRVPKLKGGTNEWYVTSQPRWEGTVEDMPSIPSMNTEDTALYTVRKAPARVSKPEGGYDPSSLDLYRRLVEDVDPDLPLHLERGYVSAYNQASKSGDKFTPLKDNEAFEAIRRSRLEQVMDSETLTWLGRRAKRLEKLLPGDKAPTMSKEIRGVGEFNETVQEFAAGTKEVADDLVDGLSRRIVNTPLYNQVIKNLGITDEGTELMVRRFLVLQSFDLSDGGKTTKMVDKVVADYINRAKVAKKLDPGQLKIYRTEVSGGIVDQLKSNYALSRQAIADAGLSDVIDTAKLYDDVLAEAQKITADVSSANSNIIKVAGEGGTTEYVRLDPLLADLYNYKPLYNKPGLFARFIKKTNQLFRLGTTGLSLKSTINQWFRDPGNAFIMSGAIVFKDASISKFFGEDVSAYFSDAYAKECAPKIISQLKQEMGTEGWAKFVADAEAAGKSIERAAIDFEITGQSRRLMGSTVSETQYYYQTVDAQRKTFMDYQFDNKLAGVDETGVKFFKERANNAMDWARKKMADLSLNRARENYLRQLDYGVVYKRGIESGMSIQDSRAWAYRFMQDSTTNFGRSFAFGNNLIGSIPYFGAALNGSASFWRLFELDPIGIFGRFASVGLAYAGLMVKTLSDSRNLEVYKNIKEYEKDDSLVWVENGVAFSIPVPQEISVFFAPIRQAIEAMHGAGDHTFWQLASHDILQLSPLDLIGFQDLDANDIYSSQTIGEHFGRGAERLISSMPAALKTAYMSVTKRDPYTGKDIDAANKGYYVDEDGNLQLRDYTQNQLAVDVAAWADKMGIELSASSAEHILGSIFGTAGVDIIGGIDSLFHGDFNQFGKTISGQILNPVVIQTYEQSKSDWSTMVSRQYAKKYAMEHDEKGEYRKVVDALATAPAGSEKRKNLLSKYKTLTQEFQQGVLDEVNVLQKKYGQTFYTYNRQAAVLSLMTMYETPSVALTAKSQEDNSSAYYNARNQAVQSMVSLGFPVVKNDMSIFGRGYYTQEGEYKFIPNSPVTIMNAENVMKGQADLVMSNIDADMKAAGLDTTKKLVNQKQQELYAQYGAKGNWKKYYAELDDLYASFNAKTIKIILPYVADYPGGVDEFVNYKADELKDWVKVPNAYMGRGKYDKAVSEQPAYIKSYIKYLIKELSK